jgi:type I restriction enzyme, S subunit
MAESQTNISQPIVKALLVLKPSLSEQELIIRVVAESEERLRSELCYCAKMKLLKKGLMQDLLTGHVRIPKEMLERGGA